MTFKSEDEAYTFYNSYARIKGFSLNKIHKKHRSDGTLRSRYMVCSSAPRKCCPARVQFSISREGIWNIQKAVLDHNHDLVTPDESAPEIEPTFQAGQKDVVTVQQPPMKTEGVDVHQDADRVTVVALQKEEHNPATTEQQRVNVTDEEVVADGDACQDADRLTDATLQKKDQHLVSTKQQPLKATGGDVVVDGEGNRAAVLKEPETYVPASSKSMNSPYIDPNCLYDQEVSLLNPINFI